ncbi:MAG: hypothetical protein KDI43_08200, partial [Gammaproteobacteria bacterium]|nr:hypothetical protein [Gammaproteobacteria bacterium]
MASRNFVVGNEVFIQWKNAAYIPSTNLDGLLPSLIIGGEAGIRTLGTQRVHLISSQAHSAT